MSDEQELHPTTGRPLFYSVGKPIGPLLVWGIIAMGAGSLFAVLFTQEFAVLVGGLASLGGIVAIAVGVGRLGEAVQFLAMRERDREHADD